MKTGLGIFVVFFIVTVIIAVAGHKDRSADNITLNMDFRVITSENSRYVLRCAVSNNTDNAIVAHLFMNSGNIVGYKKLSHDKQIPYGYFGRQVKVKYKEKEKALVNIEKGSEYIWNLPKSMLIRNDDIVGHYCKLVWHLSGYNSYPILFGFPDEQGRICFPESDMQDFKISTALVYVFNKHNEDGLGFLMLNGTDEPVVLEKPLTQASRIVASAPEIEYKRDLFLSDQTPEETTIEPGKVGEWRIPWQTIHNLIPKEDLEKIKAAGGNLDLVWKAGEFESSPLPISLAAPKEE